jgi:hypothetical protein
MKNKKYIFAYLGLFAAFAALLALKSNALSDPLGKGGSYEVTCGTTATAMGPATPFVTYHAFRVWNNSTTPVFIGGANVATTLTGMPYCTDTAVCISASESIDATPGGFFCRVASGTVVVKVIAGAK